MLRLAVLLALAACGSPAKPPTGQPPMTTPAANAGPSIGSATMLADGTLQLQLRAEGEGGLVGDALLSYPPSHENYQMILNHLGGMTPGRSKPVPPFFE
jgi:hypothetical protein